MNNDTPRWLIKKGDFDGKPYLWDDRKYDNYDLGSLCHILNEYEEKTTEVSRLREELNDIKDAMKFILDEKCADFEVHCGCVPLLKITFLHAVEEIKDIRFALGDDGRRTHREILELATKASKWREWKGKYIDLRNAHIAEGQDPAGTIWEHADKLQRELAEKTNEVERLRKENDEFLISEAALSEELKICDDWLVHTRHENARLRELLHRAIEIADNYEISGLPRDGFMLDWKVNKHEFSMLKEKMKEAA